MEVRLTKNSWHYKLQFFIFDEVPFKTNFCPYFWLTIFSLFAFPFVYFWVLIQKPITAVGTFIFEAYERWLDQIDNNICVPFKERSLHRITPEQAFILFEGWDKMNSYGGGKRLKEISARFWEWRTFFDRKKDKEDAWRDFMEKGRLKVLEMRKRDHELKQQQQKSDSVRKARIQKMHLWIIKGTKVLFFGLGVALAFFVIFLLVGGSIVLWNSRDAIWHFLITTGPYVLLALVIIVLLAGAFYLLFKGVQCYFQSTIPKVRETEKESRFISACKGFFSFFWLFIVNFKKNHCPHIEWEE